MCKKQKAFADNLARQDGRPAAGELSQDLPSCHATDELQVVDVGIRAEIKHEIKRLIDVAEDGWVVVPARTLSGWLYLTPPHALPDIHVLLCGKIAGQDGRPAAG